MTVAEALWRALEAEGVPYAFGIPGGNILPIYDAHARLAPRVAHVLVRHEQVAAHAAEGYAHATGKVGVCLATSGPGATNLVTGIADAFHDRVPLVAITGNVPRAQAGTGAFQEADIVAITRPITKLSVVVREPDALAGTLAEAFRLARAGRPGPVLVDIPRDVQLARTRVPYRPAPADPPRRPAVEAAVEVAALALHAARPLLYLGGGVRSSGASAAVRELAERLELPFVTSLNGKGAVSEDHPLWIGMIGMHGHARANRAVQRADLVLALGARLSDRGVGQAAGFAPAARIVQADIDPAALARRPEGALALEGDLGETVRALLDALRDSRPASRAAWRAELEGLRGAPSRRPPPGAPLHAPEVIERLQALLPRGAVVTTGVGQHQMFAAQRWRARGPRDFITSGGFGTMGFCLPAAIGAQLGCPEALVVGIDGDGSFQMTVQDLATAADLGLPLKLFVLDNRGLGMVRQVQRLFHARRFTATDLSGRPDLARLAVAYGCLGLRATTEAELDAAVERALAHRGSPAVVEVRVCSALDVFPMVPAGATLSEMLEGEGRECHPAGAEDATLPA
jgi:acetolactate synthase-1/2/3 large subunit